ncbi:hypothetical protein NPIL_82001 [Nephila pilipes]|uniref:Uncharacterized protein n=1 Tax=Nephila pilipes TaxID=299642 RepID=A0A8X6QX69_NEPPI|nr:hypothetical protein NPIL_82001 [Nephila pilipes]
MFLAVKSCKKEDLIFVAKEIGETVLTTDKICDVKEDELKQSFYVDNVVVTYDYLSTVISDSTELMLQGGFELRVYALGGINGRHGAVSTHQLKFNPQTAAWVGMVLED